MAGLGTAGHMGQCECPHPIPASKQGLLRGFFHTSAVSRDAECQVLWDVVSASPCLWYRLILSHSKHTPQPAACTQGACWTDG